MPLSSYFHGNFLTVFFPVLPFRSDLESYSFNKFDQIWCQVWSDLGWAKHLLLTFVSRSVRANTAFQLRFRRLLVDQSWQCLVSNLTWFRSGKAFYGTFVVWSFWANNAFQLRFAGQLFDQLWPMFFLVLPFSLNLKRYLFSFFPRCCLSASIYKVTFGPKPLL